MTRWPQTWVLESQTSQDSCANEPACRASSTPHHRRSHRGEQQQVTSSAGSTGVTCAPPMIDPATREPFSCRSVTSLKRQESQRQNRVSRDEEALYLSSFAIPV
ncbi:hypothetical protein PABG_04329 [Paracoccidioides brasiliensis Pb03]|nr:hypothetical protein PABG_04329 [Paracoccidioides brasiliensis Pb03]